MKLEMNKPKERVKEAHGTNEISPSKGDDKF
jgi:hypothetical protein